MKKTTWAADRKIVLHNNIIKRLTYYARKYRLRAALVRTSFLRSPPSQPSTAKKGSNLNTQLLYDENMKSLNNNKLLNITNSLMHTHHTSWVWDEEEEKGAIKLDWFIKKFINWMLVFRFNSLSCCFFSFFPSFF